MGQPVVHFEIIGRDPQKLHEYYGELFGWDVAVQPMETRPEDVPQGYGLVAREQNMTSEGIGIGGGIGGPGPEGYPGHVTFYVGVPDVEAALAKAESLGGARVMGPEQVMPDIEIGLFTDPEGHMIGVVKTM
jgi:predicted enzyme related to lactoylglutathione lyase